MMLINQGQAAAGVPRQRGEAVQQGWVAYFLLSFPLSLLLSRPLHVKSGLSKQPPGQSPCQLALP